mmetsp:Transcript_29683/g.44795  ORF Transcript_29683/g.44795 Transcript_29683/m.44795 type:complete len:98 (-) Transcript_29683:159-452(-)
MLCISARKNTLEDAMSKVAVGRGSRFALFNCRLRPPPTLFAVRERKTRVALFVVRNVFVTFPDVSAALSAATFVVGCKGSHSLKTLAPQDTYSFSMC